MKVLALIDADIQHGPQGLPSGLTEKLGAKPVICHTVERLAGLKDLMDIEVVTADRSDYDTLKQILSDSPCEVVLAAEGDWPHRSVLRRSRRWSRNSWRGGIGGTTVFDETGAPTRLLAAGVRRSPDVVLHVLGEGPLLVPAQLDGIIQAFVENITETRLAFADLPPGLSGALYTGDFLKSLVHNRSTAYAALRYRPESPHRDPAELGACFRADDRLRMLPIRLTSDSQRCLERLRTLFDCSTYEIARRLHAEPQLEFGRVPEEIEVHICEPTDREFPERDCFAEMSSFMDETTFLAVLGATETYDDVNLTIGGAGDPLAHPELFGFLKLARERRVHGLHVATTAKRLTPGNMDLLMDAEVDVVSVLMGGGDETSYGELFGTQGYEECVSRCGQFLERRKARKAATPFLLPIFIKSRRTVENMEAWYDKWYEEADWPVIRGWNDYAGQLDDLSVIHPTLGTRIPCRTLFNRMHVGPLGEVTFCGQDFRRRRIIGNVRERSVSEIWTGPEMNGLRAEHAAGNYESFELCRTCKDWYHL